MNIFWPVYKNLESEFMKLMYYIHIDDCQLSVYSPKIVDLILRAAIEIESICKTLHFGTERTPKKNIKFDYDILDGRLIPEWKLDKKVVIISSCNCFLTEKELYPFNKIEEKTNKPSELTFAWNNAYQNLKHDRARSLSMGCIKYLFDIMAALFLLNIYYKNEKYPMAKYSGQVPIPESQGSEIFSIHIHNLVRCHGGECIPVRDASFFKATYYVDETEESLKRLCKSLMRNRLQMTICALQTPEGKIAFKATRNDSDPFAFDKKLGIEKWNAAIQKAHKISPPSFSQRSFEAHLNINDTKEYSFSLDDGEIQAYLAKINSLLK